MVCNAGIAGRHSKSLLETTEEDWDAIMAVNLRGVFLCCKRAIGEMVEQEPIGEARGRVIIISSQHGMIGPPGHVAYAVSKGGLVNMTHQLAVDYARRGVLVNAVAPGKILTGSPEQQTPRRSRTRTRARRSRASAARKTSPARRSSSRATTPATSRASTCSSTAAGWRTEAGRAERRASLRVEAVARRARPRSRSA